MGLGPKFVSQALVNIHWKLYELSGRFYRGRPKDGSIRDADIPPFLASLLEWQIDTHPDRKCLCRNEDAPWCPGMEVVPRLRRAVWSRPSMPMLVDMSAPWAGLPMPP
jgi:hypothetical protein